MCINLKIFFRVVIRDEVSRDVISLLLPQATGTGEAREYKIKAFL